MRGVPGIKFSAACKTYVAFLCVCFLLFHNNAAAQEADTANKIRISIDSAETITYFNTDSGTFHRFVGHVVLRQGTDTLYCDSCFQNNTTKNFEAFGDVKIAQQGGTQGTSDYLKYTSAQKLAYMRGHVTLTDGKNNLKCEELTYNLGTKVAVYDNGGTLHNDSTTVTSNSGVYNVHDKNARFKGHVVILDPQYNIKSEDLLYNTETKLTEFYAKSIVTRDSGRGTLQTSKGTYDGQNGIAHFIGRSSIWNNEQYIEGDTLNYNKLTGYGLAIGHVISIDTLHHSTMYCGRAEYFQKQRILWATIKPVLVQVNGKDTLYIRADSFYSAPMVKSKTKNTASPGDSVMQAGGRDGMRIMAAKADSMHSYRDSVTKDSINFVQQNIKDSIVKPVSHSTFHVPAAKNKSYAGLKKGAKKSKVTNETAIENKMVTDTTTADSTAPLYFIGYHHVLIFSDSMQGKCDSVCYTRSDSIIRMMYNPIVWAHRSQITGDTILLQLDSSQLRRMYVPANAIVISQSGPEKAHLFDQVQGKTLTAYFSNNTITRMLVYPSAQCIYYTKDAKDAYIGVDESTSTRMRIYFSDQKIQTIKFEQEPHHTMTPMIQADLPNMKLSKFKWLIDQRPKTKEELFK